MAALLVVAFVLAPRWLEAHKPTTTRFTYHRDVRPIFESRCGSCHLPGGVAPMSLLTYKEAYPWAASIKNKVLALAMPPWFADERYGAFRRPSSLSAGEVNTIVDWCLGGTPEGNPAETPSVVPEPEISLGEPDLLLELPEPFLLDASTGGARSETVLQRSFERERFARAIEFRPGSRNVVRSALVFVVPRGGEVDDSRLVASWIPGQGPEVWPEGRGVRIPARSSIVVRIEYKKTWLDEGKEISDRSGVVLYLERGRSDPVETLVVTSGEPESLPRSIEVLAVLPRIELRVDSLLADALLPDGSTRALIRLRDPDPDWPRKYWLSEPLTLPKGSRIRLTIDARAQASLPGSNAILLSVSSRPRPPPPGSQ